MRSLILFHFLLCALVGLSFPNARASTLGGSFQVTEGNLALVLDNGAALGRESLVGLTILVTTPNGDVEVRIDGFQEILDSQDALTPSYELSVRRRDGSAFGRFCQKDPQGREAALAILGPDGKVGFTCTSGAEGKCILLGYRPWGREGDVPLRDLHRACVRMLRADYGGDGRSYTRDGTLVAVRDGLGIRGYPPDNSMPFEAAWGPDGAICVAHPRIPELVSLPDLEKRYPPLSNKVGPEVCHEDVVRGDPRAILFNRSGSPSPAR